MRPEGQPYKNEILHRAVVSGTQLAESLAAYFWVRALGFCSVGPCQAFNARKRPAGRCNSQHIWNRILVSELTRLADRVDTALPQVPPRSLI
jgi:hypothetical protein